MNAVWNSYGQLCGCPEIFKKSCKFFCRELDIRVSQIMDSNTLNACCLGTSVHFVVEIALGHGKNTVLLFYPILHFEKFLHLCA